MNELIESDPELYGADIEDIPPRKAKDKKKSEYLNNNDLMLGKEGNGILSANAETDKLIFQDIFDMDEISLQDPEEERELFKARKEVDANIHNSFTGPYPLDPTEFSHTDKGENY
jgi:hypothetical protein